VVFRQGRKWGCVMSLTCLVFGQLKLTTHH
jgi:hypothetical protein